MADNYTDTYTQLFGSQAAGGSSDNYVDPATQGTRNPYFPGHIDQPSFSGQGGGYSDNAVGYLGMDPAFEKEKVFSNRGGYTQKQLEDMWADPKNESYVAESSARDDPNQWQRIGKTVKFGNDDDKTILLQRGPDGQIYVTNKLNHGWGTNFAMLAAPIVVGAGSAIAAGAGTAAGAGAGAGLGDVAAGAGGIGATGAEAVPVLSASEIGGGLAPSVTTGMLETFPAINVAEGAVAAGGAGALGGAGGAGGGSGIGGAASGAPGAASQAAGGYTTAAADSQLASSQLGLSNLGSGSIPTGVNLGQAGGVMSTGLTTNGAPAGNGVMDWIKRGQQASKLMGSGQGQGKGGGGGKAGLMAAGMMRPIDFGHGAVASITTDPHTGETTVRYRDGSEETYGGSPGLGDSP